MTNMNHTKVAELLIDIEGELRKLRQWGRIPPSDQALSSDQPFCVDTLTLPQWLQYIFLPALYKILQDKQELPGRCGVAPMAQEYFKGSQLSTEALVETLAQLDSLLSGDED
jgi:uncharacterized protein YqcC (DUF446 family)